MLVTEFSTEVVAAAEQFALWEEVTARSHMRNRLRSNDSNDFRARTRGLDLGEAQVCAPTYPHLEIARTAKLIRQFDPEVYQINYFLDGRGTVSPAGGDTPLQPGDLLLLGSSRPCRGEVQAAPSAWSHVTVRLPRELLPLPEKLVQRLIAVPISGRRGMAGVFAGRLTDLTTRSTEFTPDDIPTLASVAVGLLASAFAGCLEVEKTLTPETRRSALKAQINAFVEQHLADPDTTPRTIADAHHISLRHLQQLLAEDDTSPAAWIRHRRLERCRLDLGNPCLNTRPIQTIAACWGFTDPTHFSRLFRATHGIPPQDYGNLPPRTCANRQHSCAE
ncbi:helix-turn-helix domain-containing protein [Streptomyces sp. NPDC079020]|uniref:AraC-like ligand-binding domain-containing protein n=1 Tax=Streptomyces sp. NPDC079020 TaxID=3365722 RepID=UPI0037CFF194